MEHEELVAQLQRGDVQCLEPILAEMGPRMIGLLRRQFGSTLDHDEIDDAISIGLYRLWVSRDRYDPAKSSLLTWFYLLVRNATIDLIRNRHFYAPLNGAAPAERETKQPTCPPEATTRRKRIADFLGGLSDTDRYILNCFAEHDGQGNWAANAAKQLQMPASTVRVRKMRLVEKLRRAVDGTLSDSNRSPKT